MSPSLDLFVVSPGTEVWVDSYMGSREEGDQPALMARGNSKQKSTEPHRIHQSGKTLRKQQTNKSGTSGAKGSPFRSWVTSKVDVKALISRQSSVQAAVAYYELKASK